MTRNKIWLTLVLGTALLAFAGCGGKPDGTPASADPQGAGKDATTSPANDQTASQGGEIEAVKLVEAWVNAGAKEKEPFTFKAKDGKEYRATFEKDIQRLFTTDNIWAPNTKACVSCHVATNENSVHEMGLGSYAEIITGGDSISNPPGVQIVIPGDFSNSVLRKRLRDNRMPPGVPFDITEANRDGPVVKSQSGGETEAVKLLEAWVNAGAKEKDPFTFQGKDGKEYKATFDKDIQRLFTTDNVWAPNTKACNSCHVATNENSVHEMGLGSYDGIMIGGDSISNPPGVKIVTPGDWNSSVLRHRVRDNRMPPGVPFDITEGNRDGPVIRAGTPVK